VKLFKLSAFVLGFLLLLQGVSPVSASESVQRYANFERVGPRNGHKNDYKHNTHVIIKDLR
jgi:hypothetical protein